MSKPQFQNFPPELILLHSPLLSTASLNALALTCRRVHEIIQPRLEIRLTPVLARSLLLWAAASRFHIIAKILSPPYSMHPYPGSGWYHNRALHIAVNAGNTEIATLLLNAGANMGATWDQDEHQPLHMAAMNKDLQMMKLLLDRGAPVDTLFGCHGYRENALHYASSIGHMGMVNLLLERGANVESIGHHGTALGFAMHRRNLEVVKCLLAKGADATVTVPLFTAHDGPSYPQNASLLYIAMGLRHPLWDRDRRKLRERSEGRTPARWEGLPLDQEKKELMALLLAHGASKETTMTTISTYSSALANEAHYTEEEYLKVVKEMLKEAEDAIPDMSHRLKQSL